MNRSQLLRILAIAVIVLIAAVGVVWYFSFDHCLTISTMEKERCWTHVDDLFKEQEPVNLNNRTAINKVLKFCDDFQTCQPALFCSVNSVDDNKTVNDIRVGCDMTIFFTTNVASCWEMIEKKDSNCLQSWKDFEAVTSHILTGTPNRPEALERKRECDRFLGMDGCLKMEIEETCGETKWKHYREFMAFKNRHLSVCDWDQVD